MPSSQIDSRGRCGTSREQVINTKKLTGKMEKTGTKGVESNLWLPSLYAKGVSLANEGGDESVENRLPEKFHAPDALFRNQVNRVIPL